ncbi:NAD-dependent epimerase/dehydratase family protein [Henriciella sp.]|uniref:NAD-dependent epimerase/dehydratase family protein n=1 Tax=Henriciella sp. TaxID=1968823 RepID=UPI0025BE82AD|nr:NAD-dependent epimerase/dehydratase family protein [Henriciella sp.]
MVRHVVLGAGGFLGGRLAESLVEQDVNPVLVRPSDTQSGRFTAVKERLSGFESLGAHCGPGSVYYYCISDMTPSNSAQEPSAFIESNLTLFVRFLEWVAANGGGHVVYTSSGGTVYGDSAIRPTPETAPLEPISFYGLLKASAEQFLSLYARQGRLTFTTARISNPFGPGQQLKRGQGLIPAVAERIKAGQPLQILGEGDTVRDYIHIDDVIAALELCGTHPALSNTVVNVGTGRGLSVLEVVQIVEEALGKKAELHFVSDRPGDVRASVLDISRIRSLTGWDPEISVEEGLERWLSQ